MSETPMIPDDLAENVRALAAERGTTVDRIAHEYDEHSPSIAAWARAQASTREDAPKSRRSASETKSKG